MRALLCELPSEGLVLACELLNFCLMVSQDSSDFSLYPSDEDPHLCLGLLVELAVVEERGRGFEGCLGDRANIHAHFINKN